MFTFIVIFILFFLCIRLFRSLSYNRINNVNIQKARDLRPENSIIIFDLHGVVFKHNYKKMFITFWKSPHRWPLLKNMLNPRLMWDIAKILYRKPIPESFFMYLSYHYREVQEALPLLIKISNCQKVNYTVINIIKELKAHHYKLAVLSNIGQLIYKDLEQKHPDIFQLFDHVMVSTPETNYISKPNPKIYERFINEAGDNRKYIILIDDKLKNLQGGAPFNFIGIRFINAARLRRRLKQIGIKL